jgi:hypothetical protein
MHQHPRFARTRPGQHQHVGGFAVVGDDVALLAIAQRFDDVLPGCRRGLPLQFFLASGQPALQKFFLLQAEIIHSQKQGICHRGQPALHIFGHDVYLENLLVVVHF